MMDSYSHQCASPGSATDQSQAAPLRVVRPLIGRMKGDAYEEDTLH